MQRVSALTCGLLAACNVLFRSPSQPQCAINNDCKNGSVCFYGTCKAAAAAALTDTWVEIIQPGGIAFAEQRSVEASGRGDLAIAQTRTWSGQMLDATTGNDLNGYILLQRVSLIPSRQLDFLVLAPVNGRFSATLEAGVYHPIFFPDNVTYAPLPLADWTVGSDDASLPIAYPDVASLVRINGRIGPSAANPTQGTSVRIFAVQAGTQLTSTATQTGADGSFSLLMSPSVLTESSPQVSLVIGPSDANTFVPTLDIALQDLPVPVTLTANTSVPDIYLEGIANTATVTGIVSGLDSNGNMTPLSGAAILAATTIGGGTFTTGSLSDASGAFTLALLTSTDPQPLSYTVDIVPPPESTYGRTQVRYDLPPTGVPAPLSIKLGSRLVLSGTVLDADGRIVVNAEVTASPQDASVVGASALQTLTGADGRFALLVDPNTYALTVMPAPGSPQPRGTASAEVTTSNVDTTVQLTRGVLMCGEVSGPSGATVIGTRLDFYRDAGAGVALIGEGVVDGNFHYSAVLPQ